MRAVIPLAALAKEVCPVPDEHLVHLYMNETGDYPWPSAFKSIICNRSASVFRR